MIQNNKQKEKRTKQTLKAYQTQAISQADHHQSKTNIAIPNDENVERAKDWVDENKK